MAVHHPWRRKTNNIVESPFDTVLLRTNAALGFKRVDKATAMIWRLLRVAEKALRHLKGSDLLQESTMVSALLMASEL